MTEVLVALLGLFGGYVLSRICWARHVDERLTRVETQLSLIAGQLGIGS